MSDAPDDGPALPRVLGSWSSLFLVVGIIVGSAIFRTPRSVAEQVQNIWIILALWVVGGLASLAGALCYAELASAYPKSGGDYHYLKRAYGGWAGFFLGWTKTLVVRPALIAMVCTISADYTVDAFELPAGAHEVLALVFIVALSVLNIHGTRTGATVQTLLTVAKVAGLLAIVAVGFSLGSWDTWRAAGTETVPPAGEGGGSAGLGAIGVAFVMVMGTYGGWAEIAMVAGEVRDPKRNLIRSMVAGTLGVTALYVVVVLSFHAVFTPAETAALAESNQQVASAVVERALGDTWGPEAGSWAARAVAILIAVSTLGAANGLILSGGRVTYAFGRDVGALRFLGAVHPVRLTPWGALLFQMGWSCALVFYGHFEALLVFSGFGDWLIFGMGALSLPILRARDRETPRPYRAPIAIAFPVFFLSTVVLFGSTIYDFFVTNQPFWWVAPTIIGLGPVAYWVLVVRRR